MSIVSALMAFAPAWPRERVVRFSPGAARKAASVSLSEPLRALCAASSLTIGCLLRLSPARPFKPAQRLRKKSEFDRVYRDARRSADAFFAIFARNTGAAVPRLGLAIAARIVGNAVRRNRIKRLVRESFRQHQHELPAVDLVVNARSAARDADNAAITRSLERHWRTVVKQCASS
jgi:ribonuclease P protein component